MTEYKGLIEEYADPSYSYRVGHPSNLEWGNISMAEQYLEKYWLPKHEYETMWKPKQDRIFINQDRGLPSEVFAPDYHIIALRGGGLCTESDFIQLQECVHAIGDKDIIVIQNYQVQTSFPAPPFRMKFPSDISWEELMSGNYISSILIDNDDYDFFVFGESAAWGKYVTNASKYPLDIIGFNGEYASLFKRVFVLAPEEKKKIYSWLPEVYKNRIV